MIKRIIARYRLRKAKALEKTYEKMEQRAWARNHR